MITRGRLMPDYREAHAIAIQSGRPTCTWGPPGIGKTSSDRSLAAAVGFPYYELTCSRLVDVDFTGIPVVNAAGDIMKYSRPDWLTALDALASTAPLVVLGLEEINRCPSNIMNQAMTLVWDRRCGSHEVPKNVVIVSAANPAHGTNNAVDLDAANANRYIHFDYPYDDVVWWCEAARARFPQPVVPKLPDNWRDGLQDAIELVVRFIEANHDGLYGMPDSAEAASRAWPSQRSWELAWEMWAAAEACNASGSARYLLIAGCVGEATADLFFRWLKEKDLLLPEDVLDDVANVELPNSPDRLLILTRSVVSYVLSRPSKDNVALAWKFFGRLHRIEHDAMAATEALDLARLTIERKYGVFPEMKLFGEILRLAGLVEGGGDGEKSDGGKGAGRVKVH